MKLSLLGCMTAVAMLAGISSASADIITVTWSGTVSGGSDVNGYFGTAGKDLTGQAFTATFVFDSGTAGSVLQQLGDIQNLFGGASFNNSNPMLTTTFAPTTPLQSSTLVINGKSVSGGTGQAIDSFLTAGAGGGVNGSRAYSSNFSTSVLNSSAPTFAQSDEMKFGLVGNTTGPIAGFPISIDQDGTYTLGAGVRDDISFFVRNGEDLNFSPLSVTVDVTASVAAVPEPSTWAMMALGFAGLGLLSYRRGGRAKFRVA